MPSSILFMAESLPVDCHSRGVIYNSNLFIVQVIGVAKESMLGSAIGNRRAHIRHQWRKTTVLSCHRCLINTDVEKMYDI